MEVYEEILESIDTKLSLIAKILLSKEEKTQREKIALISSLPLSNKNAAEIIGTSEGTYVKEKSLLKSKENGKTKEDPSLKQGNSIAPPNPSGV